jgi:hypothetical protein
MHLKAMVSFHEIVVGHGYTISISLLQFQRKLAYGGVFGNKQRISTA